MSEPIYIVIHRGSQANQLLLEWAKKNKVDTKSIDKNRLLIYNQNIFDKFRLTWSHPWCQLVIWDAWNRRHVDLFV